MMKKRYIFLILLSITIMLITASCSQNGSTKDSSPDDTPDNHTEQSSTTTDKTDDPDAKTYTETAYILDIDLENNSIMIGASVDTDYESQTCVFIKDDTDILIDLATSSLEKLSIGNPILITYTGGIAESAPAQMHHPVKIEVVKTITETVYVLDINLESNYILVGESLDTDYWSQTAVFIKENTMILIHGESSKLEDLSIGDRISFTSDGSILESAPAQIPWTFQIEVIQ